MKKTMLLVLLSSMLVPVLAQTQMENRMNLQNLLAERAKHFSAYTSSIQKRSGIFGNKTKRDMERSNEVLIAIVTLDNDIMDALNRSLNYKTFEKTTDNYSKSDCEMKLQQSMKVTDTLMKQITVMESRLKHHDSSASIYKVLFYLMLIGAAILYWRKSKLKTG